eukprot:11456.XXX_386648_386944_1 [CDS] Oithona nana genome sequencing.
MDATSGTFTAKRKGLYMFTFTAVSASTEKAVYINVNKNGGQLFHIEDGNAKAIANIASSWMLQLDENDTIGLTMESSGLHGCSDEDWVHFTGQLLNAN